MRGRAGAGAGLALALAACGLQGGREAAKVAAVDRALNGGPRPDYVAAVAAVRRAHRRPGEGDAQAGALLLRSLADPRAATRPPGTAEDGLEAVEHAAMRDPARDAGVAEGVMRYGVPGVVEARPAVAACWAGARTGAAKPATCVALRRGGG